MKIAILGVTGSIGQSALSVISAFRDKLKITAMSCGQNVELLAQAIQKFQPQLVAVISEKEEEKLYKLLKQLGLPNKPQIMSGPEGQIAVAAESGAQIVLSAIVGAAGLEPTFAAVNKGLKVALANKESLVLGGEILMPLAKQRGASIIPVDSEHSAIFQALGGTLKCDSVRRLILTASGGPFRGFCSAQLENVSREKALKHPKWAMGPKITCDSATMMNKGLEIIEAHHLFQMDYDQLEVLVHPQSIVHSIVEYIDGSQIAQLGPTDMRLAIAYSFSHPERWPLLAVGAQKGLDAYQPLELSRDLDNGALTFEEPDKNTFRALKLAEDAGRAGGTAPAILCGANDEAVDLFLKGHIKFSQIVRTVEAVLNKITTKKITDLKQAIEAEQSARILARELNFSGKVL